MDIIIGIIIGIAVAAVALGLCAVSGRAELEDEILRLRGEKNGR